MNKSVLIITLIILIWATSFECSTKNPNEPSGSIFKDFYPLETGNSWKYDYRWEHRAKSGEFDTTITGLLEWTITNSDSDNFEKKFMIREVFNGIKSSLRLAYSSIPETTIIGPDTSFFILRENEDHYLSFDSDFMVGTAITFQDSLKRFNPVIYDTVYNQYNLLGNKARYRYFVGDTITVRTCPTFFPAWSISIVADIGTYKWWWWQKMWSPCEYLHLLETNFKN